MLESFLDTVSKMPRACPVEFHDGRYTTSVAIQTGCHGQARGIRRLWFGFCLAANMTTPRDRPGGIFRTSIAKLW